MDRVALLRRGIALEGVTVGYNALEGIVAIVAGIAAGSVALTAFGIDSVIQVASGMGLRWRLSPQLGPAGAGPAVYAPPATWAGILPHPPAVYRLAESVP